jgi:hypothetical protein
MPFSFSPAATPPLQLAPLPPLAIDIFTPLLPRHALRYSAMPSQYSDIFRQRRFHFRQIAMPRAVPPQLAIAETLDAI